MRVIQREIHNKGWHADEDRFAFFAGAANVKSVSNVSNCNTTRSNNSRSFFGV